MEERERKEGMEGRQGWGEGGDGGGGEEGGDGGRGGLRGGGGKEGRKEGKMLSLLFPISNTKKAKNRMAPDNRAQLASRISSTHLCGAVHR